MSSLAESCPDLPDCVIARQLGNSQNNIRFVSISVQCKVNYGFSKKFETTEIRTFSITLKFFKGMGKVLVNSPLSHQILMNIQSFCICQTPIETNDFPNTTY